MQNQVHSVLFDNQQDYYEQPQSSQNDNDLQFYSSNTYGNQQTYGSGTTAGFTPPAPQNYYSEGINSQFELSGSTVNFASIKAAFGTGGYDDEPPLLEELGINFSDIKKKSLIVMNPFKKYDRESMGNSDLAGPILFCLIFGSLLLLRGKVHFGYIYGVASLGSLGIHLLFNFMGETGLEPATTGSILGYCLLPMLLLSAVSTFIHPSNVVAIICCIIAILWSTSTASRMFITSLSMRDQYILVAYPVALLYSCFALMAMF